VAAAPEARGLGVLVVLNDEIQAAREVTKASTLRLETFRSADLGMLGYADPDGRVAIYRRPARRHAPDTEFDVRGGETCRASTSRTPMPAPTAPPSMPSSPPARGDSSPRRWRPE
jgi:L-asparaginase/Glu-tRNA(Gln) amidotransferase subunit D